MKVYYFGCWLTSGHYYWKPCPDGYPVKEWHAEKHSPWGLSIDTEVAPKGINQRQGICAVEHLNGWTALAYWDRSTDSRPNCNAALVAEGAFNFEQMMELFRHHFPKVLRRLPFPLVPLNPTPDPSNKEVRPETGS